jgi:hypothetical protein
MNKKFVKENKKIVREFLGAILTGIITGKMNRSLRKKIENDPAIQQHKINIQKIEKRMEDKVKAKMKADREFAQKMKKAGYAKA